MFGKQKQYCGNTWKKIVLSVGLHYFHLSFHKETSGGTIPCLRNRNNITETVGIWNLEF